MTINLPHSSRKVYNLKLVLFNSTVSPTTPLLCGNNHVKQFYRFIVLSVKWWLVDPSTAKFRNVASF